MNNKETFSISPGTGMLDVLGHSGYTLDFAIADLIDNCISAKAKNINLFFDFDAKHPYFYIKDDGNGMSSEQLKQAAIIGYKDWEQAREDTDLGRYSTGLKSATRSFCDCVTISSKKLDCNANTIQLDYEHIVSSKQWEAFEIHNFFLEKDIKNSGTIVYCEKIKFLEDGFDRNSIYSKLDDLEKSLSHIFGKFLLSNKIKISIQVKGSNPMFVEGWNPFSVPENKSTKTVYQKRKDYCGSTINIKAYILPICSNLSKKDQIYMEGKGLLEQSGFYIYRNERLIQEGGWLNLEGIGLDDKSKYARIEVGISSKLDKNFEINFSKNSLVVPDDLKPLFLEVAKKARKESRSNFNYQTNPGIKPPRKKDVQSIWRVSKTSSGLVLNVNLEHPIIEGFLKEVPISTLKKLTNILSKSIPVNMIQSQDINVATYNEHELFELMEIAYQNLLKEGLEITDIKKKMNKLEPFKDYLEALIKFFDQKESKKNDK